MVTLKEVAQMCNVSVTTVSNILNGKAKAGEETRQRVLQVIKETGYQPNYIAQGLRNSKTRIIGVIAEDLAQFTTPGIIESIMAYCEEKGYRIIVQNLRMYARWSDRWYNNDALYYSILEPAMQTLLSFRVDGIIYVAGHARVIHAFQENMQKPAVMAYAFSDYPNIPSVVIDDEKSSYELVKHLLDMGHRKIGIIGGLASNIHTQQRLLGYQKALFDAKVLYEPSLVCYGDFERETGYREAQTLIEAGVSAIFCMTDRIAGGVYDYMEEHGLIVGKDVSVVGFDDQDIASYFSPSLTTTKLPVNEIGYRSAEILLNMLAQMDNSDNIASANIHKEEIRIPCEIKYRNSVGKWSDN